MSYQSDIGGILAMAERGCERLMRVGGGPLPSEGNSTGRPRTVLTAEQRARAIELGRSGKHATADIAATIGANYQATYKLLVREGILKVGKR